MTKKNLLALVLVMVTASISFSQEKKRFGQT